MKKLITWVKSLFTKKSKHVFHPCLFMDELRELNEDEFPVPRSWSNAGNFMLLADVIKKHEDAHRDALIKAKRDEWNKAADAVLNEHVAVEFKGFVECHQDLLTEEVYAEVAALAEREDEIIVIQADTGWKAEGWTKPPIKD